MLMCVLQPQANAYLLLSKVLLQTAAQPGPGSLCQCFQAGTPSREIWCHRLLTCSMGVQSYRTLSVQGARCIRRATHRPCPAQ